MDIRLSDGTIVRNVPEGTSAKDVQTKYDRLKLREKGTGVTDVAKSLMSGVNVLGANVAGMIDNSIVGDIARMAEGSPIRSEVGGSPFDTPEDKARKASAAEKYLAAKPITKRAQEFFNSGADYWRDDQEKSAQEQRRYVNSADSIGETLRRYVKNPGAAVMAAAESVPQMLPMVLTKNAPASTQAALGILNEAAMNAEDARQSTLADAKQKGATARQAIAASEQAKSLAFAATLATGPINAEGAVSALRRVVGSKAAKGAEHGILQIPKKMLAEGGQEFLQEGSSQIAQNIGAQEYDPNRPILEGAGVAGIHGAVAGGVMGGAQGLIMAPGSSEDGAQDPQAGQPQPKAAPQDAQAQQQAQQADEYAQARARKAELDALAAQRPLTPEEADDYDVASTIVARSEQAQASNPAAAAQAAAPESPTANPAAAPMQPQASGLSGVVERAQQKAQPDLASAFDDAIITGTVPDFTDIAEQTAQDRNAVVDAFNKRRTQVAPMVDMADAGELQGMQRHAESVTADPVQQEQLIEQAVAMRDARRDAKAKAEADAQAAQQQAAQAQQQPQDNEYDRKYSKMLNEAISAIESGSSDVDAFLPIKKKYAGSGLNSTDINGVIAHAKQVIAEKSNAAAAKVAAVDAAIPHLKNGDEVSAVLAMEKAGITDEADVQGALKEASAKIRKESKAPAAAKPQQAQLPPLEAAVAAASEQEAAGKKISLAALAKKFDVGVADLAKAIVATRAMDQVNVKDKEPEDKKPQVLALPAPGPLKADGQPLVSRRGQVMPKAQADALNDQSIAEKAEMRRAMAEEAGNPTGVPVGLRPRVEVPARAPQKAILPDIILRTDGKPFQSEQEAARVLKRKGATETHEITPAPEGRGVIIKAKRKGPSTSIDTEKDDILAAIAKAGGVDWEQARAQGGFDPAESGRRGHGIMRVFKKNGGMPLDRMAETLSQYGYPVTENGDYTVNALLDAIDGALRGGQIGTPQFNERLAREAYEQEAEMRALDDALDNTSTDMPSWLDDGVDNMISAADESDAVVAAIADVLSEAEENTKAEGELKNAWADWARNNKHSMGDELFIGGVNDGNNFDAMPLSLRRRQAHGMTKGGAGELSNLLSLLNNGIDRNRGRGGKEGEGSLDTANLGRLNSGSKSGSATGTSGGTAYRDGAFTLVLRDGVSRFTDIGQVDAIVVNSAIPDAVLNSLKSLYPNYRFTRSGDLRGLLGVQGENTGLEAHNEQRTGPVTGAGQETDTGAAPRGGEGGRAPVAEAGGRGQREGQADTRQGAEDTGREGGGEGNWISADHYFEKTLDNEYGPESSKSEAAAFAREAEPGATILETIIRPSGKKTHLLHLVGADGERETAFVREGDSLDSVLPEMREKLKRREESLAQMKQKTKDEQDANRDIAKRNGFAVGARLGDITPNTGKLLRSAIITADHGNGSFDVQGVSGNKQAIIGGMTAASIERAIDRAGGKDSFSLTAQTEAERLAEEQRQAAAIEEQRKAEEQARQKAEADRGLSSFTLTGSDRPADVAMAAGQNDLFAPNTRGDAYSDRHKRRISSIEAAKTDGEVDAIVQKEYADTGRHLEGTSLVESSAKARKSALARDAKKSKEEKILDDGGVVIVNGSGTSSLHVATENAKKLNQHGDGFLYSATTDGSGGYMVEKRRDFGNGAMLGGVPLERKAETEKPEPEPRTIDENGRPTDGKPIMPGDTFRTLSGRTTTPYPKQKGLKYASQWLIDNATAEAEARGDDFNAPIFRRTTIMKGGTLTPSDSESMNMYLFGEQPEVVPSILKPLISSEERASAANATPRDALIDEINTAIKDADSAGLKDAAKRLQELNRDVYDRIEAPENGRKRLEAIISDMKNPLLSGEWVSLGKGRTVFRWEGMEYGRIEDTRITEDRGANISNPWKTSDGALHETLRQAKKHESDTSTKPRLERDGYIQPEGGKKPQASANTVFTEDAATKARELLKSRMRGNRLNSGLDPEMMQAGITLAGYHIEKGARTFAAYAKAMIEDLGGVVKPYLKSWYMGVKYDPRAAGFDGMSSAAEVEVFDVDSADAEPMAADITPESLQDYVIEQIQDNVSAKFPGGESPLAIREVESTDFSIGEILQDHPAVANRREDPATYKKFAEAAKLVDNGVIRKAIIGTRDIAPFGSRPPRNTQEDQVNARDTGGSSPELGGGNEAPADKGVVLNEQQRIEPSDGFASQPAGREVEGDAPRGARVSGVRPAAGGERGNQPVHNGFGQFQPAGDIAGGDQRAGGAESGDTRVSVDRAGSAAVVQAVGATDPELSRQKKLAAQRQAESIPVVPGDKSNIDATLPFLLDGQREDIHTAENRFAAKNGHGMLFANGTGTGKTFLALGAIKRFVRQGKGNILVVVPNDAVIREWNTSAPALGLTINQLADTKDKGTGVSITTYANFGQNDSIAFRDYDLVVMDEAHNLMQNADAGGTAALSTLRAITRHEEGIRRLTDMQNRDLVDGMAERSKKIFENGESLRGIDKASGTNGWKLKVETDRLEAELREMRDKWNKAYEDNKRKALSSPRPKALFLSATPFAYEKNIVWAQGYLFDWNEGKPSEENRTRAYNEPSNYERFMIQSFGYRMRYNKLTEPDAKVDRDLMQREFNATLRKSGSLSARMLDVPSDYQRAFALTPNALGTKIDEGLNWLREAEDGKYRQLYEVIAKRFDYLSRQRLLEAMKAESVIPMIQKWHDLGKKVVVFYDFNEGGGFAPFNLGNYKPDGEDPQAFGQLVRDFYAARPDLKDLNTADLPSPLEALLSAFPKAGVYNGRVSKKKRAADMEAFNDDDNKDANLLIVQSAANAGWSAHDKSGKFKRVLINLGMPTAPTKAIQQEGRIYRQGQHPESDSMFVYMNTGTSWERAAFAGTIARRASTAENLAMGEQARGLRDAFIMAFEDSEILEPSLDEGKGSKEKDRSLIKAASPFDRAKSYYFGQLKKTQATKAREGKDYFATPEPVGMKMVEWLGLGGGEKALEPSAGHGAISRWLPDNTENTIVEPSFELISRAALNTNAKQINDSFENLNIVNKYHGIVMNPPFGVGGKTAMEHVDKAFRHLSDGGRIVALIPEGPSADRRFEEWLEAKDEKGKPVHPDVAIRATIRLPAATFERAGTTVRTRIVVIDRIKDDTARSNADSISIDLSQAGDINALFNRIENVSVPKRVAAQEAEQEAVVASNPEGELLETKETTHAIKKIPLYVAAFTRRVDGDTYTAISRIAKRHGGYYSKFDKNGAIPGFQFESEEARGKFMEDAAGISNPTTGIAEVGGNGKYIVNNGGMNERDAGSVQSRKRAYGSHSAESHDDLFASAAVPETRAEAERNRIDFSRHFTTVSENIEHGQVAAPEKIQGHAQAAALFSRWKDYSQERFIVAGMTGDGRVAEVYVHTVGLKASASVEPGIVAGMAARNPEIKSVWFAHNHPSGTVAPSAADIAITRDIHNLISAAGIAIDGHVIMGAERYSVLDGEGDALRGEFGYPARGAEVSVPMVDRMITKRAPSTKISGPLDAKRYVTAKGLPGIVLMDTQLNIVGFWEMSRAQMRNMRGNKDSTRSLMAAIDASNATMAVISVSDENEDGGRDWKNASAMLGASGISVVDVINYATGRSIAESGGSPDQKGKPFYSAAASTGPGLTITRAREILAADPILSKALPYIDIKNSTDEVPGGAEMLYLPAWHGSPYKFDKFSLEHMGKGEGAQAYGWGLYFAGNKAVAEYYRDELSNRDQWKYANAHLNARGQVLRFNDDPVWAAEVVREARDQLDPSSPNYARLDLTLKMIESGDYAKPLPKEGSLYRVEIPEEGSYLLWDMPLDEQPDAVKKALASAEWYAHAEDQAERAAGDRGENATGRDIYKWLAEGYDQEEASKMLSALGISGIKYLDGASRSKGEGNHNYVVFDDNAVKIMETFYSAGSNNTAEGYYHNGRITLFADNIRPFPPAQLTAEERLKWVAFHEITHRGVANLSDSDTYLSELGRAAKHPYVKNLAKRIYDQRQALDKQFHVSMEVAAEEALAEISAALRTGNIRQIKEQYGLHFPLSIRPRVRSALSRFFEAAKRILNRAFGRGLTDEQLESLLGRTQEAGMGPGRGKKGDNPGDGARYSAPPSPGKPLSREEHVSIMRKWTFSAWAKTFGTQLNTAMLEPLFRPTYNLVQRYLQHTSNDAYDAIRVAPNLLGRLEDWNDYKREIKAIGKFGKINADREAAAVPLFEGTRFDKKVYSTAVLKRVFGLTDEQVNIYREARAAVEASLDSHAKSVATKILLDAGAVKFSDIDSLVSRDVPVAEYMRELRGLLSDEVERTKEGISSMQASMEDLETGDADHTDIKRQIKREEARLELLGEAESRIGSTEETLAKLKQEGYFPLMRWGKYSVSVKDKQTGEVIDFRMVDGLKEQAKLVKAMEDQYPDAIAEGGEMDEGRFKDFQGISPETIALFARELGADKDAAFQEYLKLALPGQSALKRRIHRKGDNGEGIAGFSTDIQRTLAAFVMGNARNSARNIYSKAIREAVDAIPSNKGGVRSMARDLAEYVTMPEDSGASVSIRNALFLWNMGGSVAFGALNLTQPWMMTLPWLSQFSKTGSVASAIKKATGAAFKAQKDGAIPDAYREEYDRAVREGHVDPQNVFMLQGVERGSTGLGSSITKTVSHGLGMIAAITESVNRKVTLFAALDIGRGLGAARLKELGFASPYEFAVQCISETQGVYNKGNRMAWARGDIGSILLVFKQYAVNWTEMLARMMRNHYGSDPMRKGAMLMLGILFSIAGALGLPLADDLKDLAETGAGFFGKPVNIERQMQMTLGKDMADAVLAGPLNATILNSIGLDMHGRMSMGNIIPATNVLNPYATTETKLGESITTLGAGTGLLKKGSDALASAQRGDFYNAAAAASPRAVESIMKGARMLVEGKARDSRGNVLMETGPLDAAAKMLDFQPASVAITQRERGRRFQDKSIQSVARDDLRTMMISAYESGDQERIREARLELKDWNENNPLYPVRLKERDMRRAAKKRGQSWIKREDLPKGMEWVDEYAPENK